MNFASDNAAGVAPAIMAALARANGDHVLGYGEDHHSRAAEALFAKVFGREVATYLVATGTAANALALAHITPPWGAVLCHEQAHIANDECGAPEFFGAGLKLITLQGDGGKLAPRTVEAAIARYSGHRPHQVNAAALSLTQATEAGTVYRPEEIKALCDVAHAHGLKVHMDGSRFANALARLGQTPAAVTWLAGVDVLSFGATKGGALAAEAVVFFDPTLADAMPERRKRGGHLLSKHRFLAAQFSAFFANDLWLNLARHANAMADRLADGLTRAGLRLVWPVEANMFFVVLPASLHRRLQSAGAIYYARPPQNLPPSVTFTAGDVLARLVTAFDTTDEQVDAFLDVVHGVR